MLSMVAVVVDDAPTLRLDAVLVPAFVTHVARRVVVDAGSVVCADPRRSTVMNALDV